MAKEPSSRNDGPAGPPPPGGSDGGPAELVLDADGVIVSARRLPDFLGPDERAARARLIDWLEPANRPRFNEILAEVGETGRVQDGRWHLQEPVQGPVPADLALEPDGEAGDRLHCTLSIAEPGQDPDLSVTQRSQLLELISRDAPPETVYRALLSVLVSRYPAARCVVTRWQGDALVLQQGSGIPPEAADLVTRQPLDPNHSPCTMAALNGELTATANLREDPRWARYREPAEHFGVFADWSCPIPGATPEDRPRGTVAVLHADPRLPTPREEELLRELASLAERTMARAERLGSLEDQAFLDPVTGIATRSVLLRHLEGAIERARNSGEEALYALLDLDQFKPINDQYGHHVGDEVLREIAARLEERLRPGDIVGRLGGDEFGLVLRDCSTPEAPAIAGRLFAAFSEPVAFGRERFHVTPSVGIAPVTRSSASAADVARTADVAMYRVKRGTGNAYEVAAEPGEGPGAPTSRPSSGSAPAVTPIPRWDSSKRIRAVRLHTAWLGPDGDELPAERFLRGARNRQHLEEAETAWIMALRDRILELSSADCDLTLVIEPTGIMLADDGFPERLFQHVRANGIDPHRLEIDISGAFALNGAGAGLEAVANRLREVLSGARMAVSDIGSGTTAFDQLMALEPETAALSGRLCRKAGEDDPAALAVLQGLRTAAAGVSGRVAATAVATEAQWEKLKGLGIEYGEGDLVGPPGTG